MKEFLNADSIAAGLSPLDPAVAGIQAARLLLARWQELAAARKSFAVESTLSGRTYVKRLLDARRAGYRLSMIYLWLSSADFSLRRVRQRVRKGGHDVSTEDARRRYFFTICLPMADGALLIDASRTPPQLVAEWDGPQNCTIFQPKTYERIREQADS